jgi:hypothetical protein
MKTYGGVAVPQFLTSALDGGEYSASRPCRFTPMEKAPDIHWIGAHHTVPKLMNSRNATLQSDTATEHGTHYTRI